MLCLLYPGAGTRCMNNTCYVYHIQELELDEWIVTRDSDWGEGYSSAELKMNSAGTGAVFSGELSTRVPADGRTEEAGQHTLSSSINRAEENFRIVDIEINA